MSDKETSAKKSKLKSVFIATPAYDGKVTSDFAQSLAAASFTAAIFGINVKPHVIGNGAFIDLARNYFVHMFLQENKDCTHFFFIDADLKFEARAFVELVMHTTKENPVTAGVYRRRQEPEDYPCVWAPHPELSKDGIDKLWLNDEGWLLCDRVPTGFLCIHRTVLEEMAKDAVRMNIKERGQVPRLFYTFLDDKNQFVGEDYAWCDDYVKKYNRKIPVWPDFDFTHDGYDGNFQKYLAKSVAELKKDSTKKIRKLGAK